jgi:4-aminobutyrate aminotransferase-like enzyme
MLGVLAEKELAKLKKKYECIGDIRGKGLYRMLDIVKDQKSRTPDPVMAERIRYYAALEGCTQSFRVVRLRDTEPSWLHPPIRFRRKRYLSLV